MKIKCESAVVCGVYHCAWNCCSRCVLDVAALDADGVCVLYKEREAEEDNDKNIDKDAPTF